MAQFRFDWPALAQPSVVNGALPSFIHVIIMSCLTAAITGLSKNSYWKIPATWLLINIGFELLQLKFVAISWLAGTFNLLDIVAACLAAALTGFYLNFQQNSNRRTSAFSIGLQLPIVLIGSLGITGSLIIDNCEYPNGKRTSCEVKPLYMPWDKIRKRNQVYFSADNANTETQSAINEGALIREYQEIHTPGKIYLFNDYLFVNDRFKGIYIFDNTDQTNPKYLAYVSVVGATDMEVLNGVMYVNSFTDIVAIELASPFSYQRSENLLPYPNAENWLPSNAYFSNKGERIEINENKGMVVGYEIKGGKRFFFWDVEL
ncbi:hypothetical protein ACMZOO_19150 (plasmid) [Catenovulum sp. SX2]|uniref:hypothetical protein n=1 Tax=Catenovulum sp. SX2 TaxID=3398614 RepID=UPI003F85D42D